MARITPVDLSYTCIQPKDCHPDIAPVIFIHGYTSSKEDWDDIPHKVAEQTKRTVYAVDVRNHGNSVWTEEFDFFCITDDLLLFLDTNNIPKAVVVGHSMGGLMAMRAALKAPERFVGLIVEDISFRKVPPEVFDLIGAYLGLMQSAIEQVPASKDKRAAKKCIAKYIIDNTPKEFLMMKPNLTLESLEESIHLKEVANGKFEYKGNIRVLRNYTNAAKTSETTEPRGQFVGPTLFIYGKLSEFNVGDEEENLRKLFPSAEFVCIEGATHEVHKDRPHEFFKALINAL